MCHKTWSEKFNYLCFDMTKNKTGSYRILNESKNTYIDYIFIFFSFSNVVSI